MKTMSDGLKFFGGTAVVFALGGYLFGWALISFQEFKCRSYGEVTGYEVKTITGGTCMINDPDKGWMSYEERVRRR
jgi:hypothetical protein